MMKRVVLLLVLGVVLVSGVFGGGTYETKQIKDPGNGFHLTINPIFGKTDVILLPQKAKDKVRAWAVRIDNDTTTPHNENDYYSSPFYKNMDGTVKKDMVNSIIDSRGNQLSTAVTIAEYSVTVTEYSLQALTADQINETVFNTIKGTVNCNFPVKDFGKEIIIEIVILYEKQNNQIQCMYINANMIPEFFKGERELFATNTVATYDQKCYSFMKSFFQDNQASEIEYQTSITKVFKMSGGTAVLDYKDKKNEYYSSFKKAIHSQFFINYDTIHYEEKNTIIELELPYLELTNGDTYDFLYGDKRNKYIAAYLRYLFEIEKPVLSYILQERLNSNNKDNFASLYYDYTKYEEIGETMRNRLAENSLKYLTWGLEYTPFSGSESKRIGNSTHRVYEDNKDRLKSWMDPLIPLNREKNYFNETTGKPEFYSQDTSTEPDRMQIFEGIFTADKLRIAGKMKTGKEMSIKRIEFWTSRNIAWDADRVIPFCSGAGPGYSYNTAALNDKEIILDKQKNKNLHIERSGDSAIEVGYSFPNLETVGGILVIRGLAATPKEKNYALDMVKIYYKNEVNKWIKVNNTDAKEYVVRQTEKDIHIHAQIYFGHGIYSNKHSKNNDKVIYSYYVFNEARENCRAIKIVDETGNSYLNVSELLVFPENPINFKTKSETNKDMKTGIMSTMNTIEVDNEAIFYNCNPNSSVYLGESRNGMNWLDMDFGMITELKTIILYEGKENPGDTEYIFAGKDEKSTLFQEDAMILFGANDLIDSLYYNDSKKIEDYNAIVNEMTTPFRKIENGKTKYIAGNPIPYAPEGIDSPRTFNYKMIQQLYARYNLLTEQEWNFYNWKNWGDIEKKPLYKTTMAIDDIILDYFLYADEIETFKTIGKTVRIGDDFIYVDELDYNTIPLPNRKDKTIKPFLPGFYINTDKGYIENPSSLYYPDKIAGVDSMGLLMGAVSISNIDKQGVVTLFNNDTGDELDKYHVMSILAGTNIPGLDDKAKPVYYATEESTCLNGNYHFTRTDLEKSTIIVPDLSLVKKGDIVVKYGIDNEPHIGIVVKADEPVSMNTIYVVSVRRGFRMTTLGTWGNEENGFGGFASNPETYHVRRLLKLTGSQDKRISKDKWESVSERVVKLVCDLVPADTETGSIEHWIPNTEELVKPFRIKIEGRDINERPVPVDEKDIIILEPRDPYFNPELKDEDNNIHNNRGKYLLFYAIDTGDDTKKDRLATFLRDEETEQSELTMDTHYKAYYNNKYFINTNNGYANEYFECRVKNGYLHINYEKAGEDKLEGTIFTVKVLGPNIRPGDDFQLRFGLAEDPEVTGKVEEEDFMAVYDKRLLWRANLYVDETLNENGTYTGNPDWNDLNPWLGNTQNPNEWRNDDVELPDNLTQTIYDSMIAVVDNANEKIIIDSLYNKDNNIYRVKTTLTTEQKNNGIAILQKENVIHRVGGQIRILPWTRPYKVSPAGYFSNPQKIVHNAIAYDWGGMDSPGDFNLDIHAQANSLTASGQSAIRKNPTLAPGDEWRNYIKIDGTGGDTVISVGIDAGQYQPFRPCLNVIDKNSDKWYPEDVGTTITSNIHNGYTYHRLKYSAGADCNGMIQRAASYNGTKYTYGTGNYNLEFRLTWNGTIKIKALPNTEEFSDELNSTHIELDKNQIHLLVPGDVVWSKNFGHYVMIYKIEYAINSRKTPINGELITVVEEMTSGNAEYHARNDRRLNTWADAKLYRLKVIKQ
ncbi:MAG: hypothetical protein JXB88_20545 [Spirochaetales bacterium]|nr:hypothetical protein [Spirochaetales bacterium]